MSSSGSAASPLDDPRDDRVAGLLERAEANVVESRRLAWERLELAAQWADEHPHDPAVHRAQDVAEVGAVRFRMWAFAPAELALALQLHPLAAQRLIGDALDLQTRLPHTWAAVRALRLEAWVARKIATATRELAHDAARYADAALAESLGSLPPGRLLTLVEARVVEADTALADAKAEQARTRHLLHLSRATEHDTRSLFARCDAVDAQRFYATADRIAGLLSEHSDEEDPESMDALRARAIGILADPAGAAAFLAGNNPGRGKTTLYVHINPDTLTGGDGVARVEGIGAYTRKMLIRLLGHERITLKPVIDLNEPMAADCYETPAVIAERLHLIKPFDIYPHATSLARSMDKDHTLAYDGHGPPGQTNLDNLGLMVRRHHRIKTHAPGWSVEQLDGHRYLWRSPHGRYRITDGHGTHHVETRPARTRLETYLAELALAA